MAKKSIIPSKKMLILLLAGAVVIAFFVIAVLEKTQVINLFGNDPAPIPNSDAKTTSKAPTANENFSDGDERLIPNNAHDEGIVKDTSGNSSQPTDTSKFTRSSDGAITVYTPSANSLLISGGQLVGASSLSKVSFRLIDDVSGVKAQGTLSVVNGRFSGTFEFTTAGTNGRLDLFNMSADGVESSNVEIPVRFK
jgi:hypothetical protein